MALILYRVMRMRLKANDRDESPTRLLQQLQRIHQQTVRTADGQALHGLTEMTPAQIHRPPTANTDACRTLPARPVVCAFDPQTKQINDLRAVSVELGEPRPPLGDAVGGAACAHP